MHRVLQILMAIAQELMDSNLFGDRVYLQRTVALSELEQELDSASVFMGPNEPLQELVPDTLSIEDSSVGDEGLQDFDFGLTAIITVATTAPKEPELLAKLLQLDSSVHRAVMALRRHGLDFVIGTAQRGHPEGPLTEAAGEHFAGSLESRYLVFYRSRASTPE